MLQVSSYDDFSKCLVQFLQLYASEPSHIFAESSIIESGFIVFDVRENSWVREFVFCKVFPRQTKFFRARREKRSFQSIIALKLIETYIHVAFV